MSNSNWAQNRDPLCIPPSGRTAFFNNQLSFPLILFSCKSSTSVRLFIKWHPLTSNNSWSWQLYYKRINCQTQGNWMDVGWAGWVFFFSFFTVSLYLFHKQADSKHMEPVLGKNRNAAVIVLLCSCGSLPCVVQWWQCCFMPEWAASRKSSRSPETVKTLRPSRFISLYAWHVYFKQRWNVTEYNNLSEYRTNSRYFVFTWIPIECKYNFFPSCSVKVIYLIK